MMHATGPVLTACLLVGLGLYGILARRHAVLLLIGVELVLGGAGLLLVTAGALGRDEAASGQVLTLFVITIAAAEVVLALAVIVAAYRGRGHVDLAADAGGADGPEGTSPVPAPGQRARTEAPR